jgi:adenine-specific DNA-methyltransferase
MTQRAPLARNESGEKLGLVWRDIPEDVEILLRDEIPVLIHEKELDIPGAIPSDQAHILIEGDNLHALHVLQATHRGKVDVIYIDPPYNTGNDFRYNDKIIDKENPWRHSAWLSFMSKRLVVAKELLRESGVLLISIDDNEQHRLHSLCEEIFGESNFLGTLSWQNSDTIKNDAKFISPNSEALLVFARNRTNLSRLPGLRKGEKQKAAYKNPDGDPRGPYILSPLYAKSGSADKNFKFTFSNGQKWSPPVGRFHRYSRETLERLDTEGRLALDPRGKKLPMRKTYLSEVSERMPLWTFLRYEDFDSTRQSNFEISALVGKGKFPNPKPSRLIRKLVDAVAQSDALVLDFFAGSGTTLHAVAELNAQDQGSRRCILVTNNENEICREVAHPRIKAVLTGKWADKGRHDPLPGSLVFYRTEFAKRLKSPDRMRSEIAKHTVDLIAVKEGTARTLSRNTAMTLLKGSGKTIAVVPGLDPDHADLRKTAERKVAEGDRKVVYLFTWSDNGVEEEIAALWSGWEVNPLPAEMLAALRRLAPSARLFDDVGGDS